VSERSELGTAATDRYDHAIARLVRYHPGVVAATASLVEDEPGFAMGHALAAYLYLTSTDAADLEGARCCADALGALARNEQERAHHDAVTAWLAGDWHGAARRLDDHLIEQPDDVLALLVGHQLDFFRGDAQNLRDRVGRSLGRIDPAHPLHGFVRGMYAFGLEESGNYELAEAHGLAAVETNPDDVWATHAVVHVYEMRGQVDAGIGFLRAHEADWTADNLFTVHNWWHLALFLLEAGQPEGALAVYDAQIHHDASTGVPLEMLDASALLWRLLLDGVPTGDRFGALADAWATRTGMTPWYVFNDVHATMALAGAGRLGDARAVVHRLQRYVSAAPTTPGANVAMTAQIGLPASRAVLAFVEDRHDDVVAELLPIRARLQRFGGSHAQRDALQRTLLVSALRSRRVGLASALLSERLAARQTSVYAWGRRAELARLQGDEAAQVAAAATAAELQTRFAAATDGWMVGI
jgi:tetratricopeptide (TPR) repeat protein